MHLHHHAGVNARGGPEHELCRVLDRCLHGHLRRIWDGQALTPVECEAFRTQWLGNAGKTMKDVPQHLRPPNGARTVVTPSRCPHLSKRVRDSEGHIITRQCGSG